MASRIGETARRTLAGLTGSIFLLFGLAPFALLTWAIVVQRQSIPNSFVLRVYAMSIIGISIGAILLFKVPFAAMITKEVLFVRFVFFERSIPLSTINWYRYIARRWKFNGKVTLLSLVRYREKDGSSQLILLELESREPKCGWRTRNYTSELNSFIPEKDTTRR